MWKALLDKSGKNLTNSVLNLKNTLMNGQSFNWKIVENYTNDKNQEFIGYIGNLVFVMTEKVINPQKENQISNLNERIILYKLLNKEQILNKNFDMLQFLDRNKFNNFHYKNLKEFSISNKINVPEENLIKNEKIINEYDTKIDNFLNNLLLEYFQMEINMPEILKNLSGKLPSNMVNVIKNLEGVRIVKQDVFECTISFICSSNNNIERIRKMLITLRENYGDVISEDEQYGKIFSFPSMKILKKNLNESKLRDLGYGYRAKYIVNSLELIEKEGEDWLYELNDKEDIWEELIKLNGVGRKVADCISLFSLRKHQIVPLDIHMIKFYNETIVKLDKKYKKIENLTKNVYEKASNIYSETFGEYAGWVHSVFYLNRVDKERPDYLNENTSSSKSKSKSGKRKSNNYEDENILKTSSKKKK